MNLLKILYSSFIHTKNIYRSLFGNNIYLNTNNNDSELNKKNWSLSNIIAMISSIFIPTLPIYCPDWMPTIIKNTVFGGNSYFIEDNTFNENLDTECILFVNGILTNKEIIYQNINLLKKIFNRPVHAVFNNTDSLIMDLIECMIGKQTNDLTEASFVTLSVISKLVLNPNIKKLIIICHSQGTIIMAQVLTNLSRFGLDKEYILKKMEIYAFANCSTKMKYIVNNYPYMEHLANENDIIAKMGGNCHPDIEHLIDIDGKRIINPTGMGHLFNSHYLHNLTINFSKSKLLNYIDV